MNKAHTEEEVSAPLLEHLRRVTSKPELEYSAAPVRFTAGNSGASILGFRLRGAPDELSGPLSVHVRIEPWLEAIVREPVEVLLALTKDGLVSEITLGENKGRRLAHTGVVRWMT